MAGKKTSKGRLRDIKSSDKVLTMTWLLFIGAGLALLCAMLWTIVTWKEDPIFSKYLESRRDTTVVTPVRGNILDYKDRTLATSTIVYDVYMDCKVAPDSIWKADVKGLAAGLAGVFGEKSAAQWESYLLDGRGRKMGALPIHNDISQMNILRLRKLPIFRMGRFEGGYVERRKEKRMYPYGAAAGRTIGYVKDNKDTSKVARKGIEGAYDKYLHGENGIQIKASTDYGKLPVGDLANRKAVNGMHVRTTLDIDIQNIAEKALRKSVEKSDLIEKACVIVMDTKSGAIRAMVNLGRNDKNVIGEWNNYAVLQAEAPGSVFKGAVVAALMEDGYITSLEEEVPTFEGKWTYNGIEYKDIKHVGPKRFPSGKIKIREAFEMSANNPFRQLICDPHHYGDNPARFVDKVKSFGLFDTLEFDLHGISKPFILDPSMKKMSRDGSWDGGTFPGMAIGYGMRLSPLNIITFYNCIANGGDMMKPYLVDAILDGDKVVEKHLPQVLRKGVLSKTTVDTLKRVMGMVTTSEHGTAYLQLKDAVCPIAGKTGTAQRVFLKSNGTYGMKDGNIESQQATFVGFFPVDKPKYTTIVVLWSRPSSRNFFGATYAAPPFREIADKIYCLNED